MRVLEFLTRPDVIAGLAFLGLWSVMRFACSMVAALEATGRASMDRLLGPAHGVEW